MKQMSLVAAGGFARNGRVTKRAKFLAEMDQVVPWSALCAVVDPFYPKAGNGYTGQQSTMVARIDPFAWDFHLKAESLSRIPDSAVAAAD
jgi:hypothetical protein